MFSRIVEQIGKIISFENNILLIEEPNLSKELNISESIAINGICLTVINKDNNSFSVEVTPETIKRTIPIRKPNSTGFVWLPSKVLSRITSLHQKMEHNNKNKNPNFINKEPLS